MYNFKKIQVVPGAKDMVDIVLSRTNRKTATIIHKGYNISRIRSFYMKKVKYTQQTFHDKLSQILDDFPILDEIHPFYEDLINVLYNRDHYKLALGQVNHCRHYIDGLSKDYVRLLKYGDSLFRCKQLKRAALGRMCTMMKKQAPNLAYLEQVRQHLSRLPSIDPNTRTLLLCGYPNVGKSSFINKLTRADVEVQPYAFTTKSLFIGHTDYQYTRWQVIDTPGILDHPLEDRNTIEMQSITALAHLRATVLFLIDVSEQCGFSLEQQLSLFKSIKPLFSNKPLLMVANKVDVKKVSELSEEKKEALETFLKEYSVDLVESSTVTEEGITLVKEKACGMLMAQRVEMKMKSKNATGLMNRLHVAVPRPRDNKVREAAIPPSVLAKLAEKAKTQEMVIDEPKPEISITFGGPMSTDIDTQWNPRDFSSFDDDLREKYLLKNPEWRFDIIPEIIDGKNIADFLDPDIEELLDRLEQEEVEQLQEIANSMDDDDEIQLTEEEQALLKEVKETKAIMIKDSRLKQRNNNAPLPRKAMADRNQPSDLEKHLTDMGIDPSRAVSRARSVSRGRSSSRKGSKSPSVSVGMKRNRDDVGFSPGEGLRDPKQKKLAMKKDRKEQNKLGKAGKKGDSDRNIVVKNTKHLLTGKRGMGTNQRR